jgi:preprotein translocase subunit SecB
MSENAQPVFSIEKLYVKDLSVEVPNAPQIFLEREAPAGQRAAAHRRQRRRGRRVSRSALTVTVTAKLRRRPQTVFLVEVAQAGIFQIRNVPQEELEPVMMIGCANILFPYAREAVSDAVSRAGFQPVLLSPVNFEAHVPVSNRQQADPAGGQGLRRSADPVRLPA